MAEDNANISFNEWVEALKNVPAEYAEEQKKEVPKPIETQPSQDASKPQKAGPKYLGDFKKGSEIVTVMFEDNDEELEKKIARFSDIMMKHGIEFRMDDIFYRPKIREAVGINLKKTKYVLQESLSDKVEEAGATDITTFLLSAKDAETGKMMHAMLPAPVSMSLGAKGMKKMTARFRQACYLLARTRNENMVSMNGVVSLETPGGVIPVFGIAVEWLQSYYTLRQVIDKAAETGYRLRPDEVVAIGQPIANALRDMHNDKNDAAFFKEGKERLLHRGVNPSAMVLIPGDAHQKVGMLKLYDFGLAKMFLDETPKEKRTEETEVGLVEVKNRYISWEQANAVASKDLDGKCDAYSLGVILYELVTGESPYLNKDNMHKLMDDIKSGNIKDIDKIVDQKIWGAKKKDSISMTDMIKSSLVKFPIKRLEPVQVRGGMYSSVARIEETLKAYAEQSKLFSLLDDKGQYSKERASYVRLELLQRLFPDCM